MPNWSQVLRDLDSTWSLSIVAALGPLDWLRPQTPSRQFPSTPNHPSRLYRTVLCCTLFVSSLPDATRAAWPRSIPEPPSCSPAINRAQGKTYMCATQLRSQRGAIIVPSPTPIPCSSSALAALVARNASAGLIVACTVAIQYAQGPWQSCSWWLARTTSHDGHPPSSGRLWPWPCSLALVFPSSITLAVANWSFPALVCSLLLDTMWGNGCKS